MRKRVYISSDYSEDHGDLDVVEELMRFAQDQRFSLNFIDMAQVASGSISEDNNDCRPCELKKEFNEQINASSAVIFVVGDRTAIRTAGSNCYRGSKEWFQCNCTPYKQNTNGSKLCKVQTEISSGNDVSIINTCSYLEHEFKQAVKKGKKIIILYNAKIKMESWLPAYMSDYRNVAHPFWIENIGGGRRGDYVYLKQELL